MNSKLKVAIFFGGRSTEHEVSVITALQAYNALNKDKYEAVPVYISKQGVFYTNPAFWNLKNYKNIEELLLSSTKITLGRQKEKIGFYTDGLLPKFKEFDIAFPIFHGSFGEDGCIQGIFEMYKMPYVGFVVAGSAVAMDKVYAKAIFTQIGLPIGKFTSVTRLDWVENPKECLKKIALDLKFPMFIKPATSGSSIGVNKASNQDELSFAIEVASVYSNKILIEEAFENIIEVNCSALGYKGVKVSVCEMPIVTEEILTFADKYQRGGKGSKGAGMASLSRKIPAPISRDLTKQIQDATIKIFKALDGCGVARVDYFVDPKRGKFWVNELNSPPGSLSFYLWEPTGVSFEQLLDILIQTGMEKFKDQSKTQFVFESGLLSQMAQQGGAKS